MTEKGNIEKIFSEGFENFQAEADISVWNSIENQLQVPVSVPAAGVSVVTKTIIGLTIAAIITAGVLYFNKSKDENSVNDKSPTQSENTATAFTTPKEDVPGLNSDDKNISTEETAKHIIPQTVESDIKSSAATKPNLEKTDVGTAIPNQNNLEINKIDPPSEVQKEVSSTNSPSVINSTKSNESKFASDSEKESTSLQPSPSSQSTNTPAVQQTLAYKPFPLKYNIITPNGDGNNDVFYLEADGLDIISIEAFILDASNRRVGFINSLSSYWDGKDLKGNILPNGNYRIIISATGADGTNYKGQKEIILYR